MHFDDRLATVLRIRADGSALRRIQFRQLVDLLGTAPAEARGATLDAAYSRLGELAERIPVAERARMLDEPGLRLRSPRLVAALAAQESAVARAALTKAGLDEEQWLDLLPALPPAARAHLRARHDIAPALANRLDRLGVHARGLPPASVPTETGEAPARPEPQGIGAIVRRIEAFRKQRAVIEHAAPGEAPRLPLGEEHVLHVPAELRGFDLVADAAGQVIWADPGVAPMVIGLHLAARDETSALGGEPELGMALRRRQPLRTQRVTLSGAPAICGDWQLDALPWFDPLTGAFAGYRGRMRRPAAADQTPPPANPVVRDSEADRIRQMLHELRTPVNAIQGFAEVIQQQLFGPTPHEYRALASSIVGDAARMLSAFEELERLAKLDSGAIELDDGSCDAVPVLAATIAQLDAHTHKRGSGFALKVQDQPLPVAMAQLELERLAWRLLATLAGTAAPGEMLKARLRARGTELRLDLALPASLARIEGDALFKAGAGAVPQVVSAGVFGVGFALRLARAEAHAAGGKLARKHDRLRLVLPLNEAAGLTANEPDHNHG